MRVWRNGRRAGLRGRKLQVRVLSLLLKITGADRNRKGGQFMQRRCTQSTCRRVFRIGASAPVRCPYCGTSYPRLQPDIRASMIPFGYSVRADLTDVSRPQFLAFKRLLSENFVMYCFFGDEPAAFGVELSLREARALCRDFRQQGIRADVITTRDGQRQNLQFFRSAH